MNTEFTKRQLRVLHLDFIGSEMEVQEALQDLKTDGFIAKPFTTEKLLKMAHDVLSKQVLEGRSAEAGGSA